MGLKAMPAQAASNNDLIDDGVFDSANTMSAAQIDSWLNSSNFPSSCISTNSGFSAPDPTGYSPDANFVDGHYQYGSAVSAGTVIYHLAQAYQINPQVLLTKLQNEEGLVDGSGPYGCGATAMASAVGYDCVDSGSYAQSYTYTGADPYSDPSALVTPLYYRNGVPQNSISSTCVGQNVKAGFSEQLDHAAWLLTFSRHKAEGNTGWAVITGNWNHCEDNDTCAASYNIPAGWSCYGGFMTQGYYKRCPYDTSTIYYDGYATIDGTSTHMDTGATAALYVYTPHFQSFDSIFQSWFGAATGANYSFIDSTGPLAQILPNDVINVVVHLQNNSGSTWYSDGNVPQYLHPTRLAMLNYQNTPFANPADPAWLGTSNQVKMVESSVPDGGTATFQFTLKGPLQQIGMYAMKFAPVLDGVKFYPYIGMEWDTSTPAPVLSYQVTNSSGLSGTMATNYTGPASLTIKNTGNVVWFNEASKPVGAASLRLLTAKPFYHGSGFYDSATWLANNQIAMATSKVTPSYSGIFTFNIKTPAVNGSYSDSFGLVLDGAAVYPDTSQIGLNINVADYSFSVVSSDIPSSLLAGQKYTAKVILKNTGFVTWYSDGNTPSGVSPVRLMMAGYQNNPLADQSDPNWLGTTNQIKMTSISVAPGSNGEFDFSFIAPYNLSGYTTNLRMVDDGVWIVPTPITQSTLIPNKTFSYDAVTGTINPPLTMSPGQVVTLKLMVKNNTNFIWYSDDSKPAQFRGGGLRIVMANPWYRSSALADTSDSAWMGTTSQIKMVTATVNPGDTAEFDFSWKAPSATGLYKERFAPVLDGYSIFPDIGMEFDTTVQ